METHYTYSMPDGTGVGAFTCPYGGSGETPEGFRG